MSQTCLNCQDAFRGRIDKKYCSDYCRSAYHNKSNLIQGTPFKMVNSTLKKNYRILNTLTSIRKRVKTNRQTLEQAGFNFNYFTNVFPAKNGKTYYFCYDRGYIAHNDDLFSIVVKKEYIDG